MKRIKITYLFCLMLFVGACSKKQDPYSIFKSSNYSTIEKNKIKVDLASSYSLVVEVGYEFFEPLYLIQRNSESPYNISDSSFVSKEIHGWNGEKGLDFETVKIDLVFDSLSYTIGDEIKIISRHSGMEKFKTIVIE